MVVMTAKRLVALLEDIIYSANQAADSSQAFGAELGTIERALIYYKNYLRDRRFVELFDIWQNDNMMHPWTCGNDGTHKLIVSYAEDGSLGPFRCYLCDYKQEITEDVKRLVLGEK